MAYIDKYEQYLQELSEDVKKCKMSGKRTVFGYTSNLDVVIDWDIDKFNQLLAQYLKEEPSLKEGDTIDCMESFARIVSYYVLKGMGGEIDITDNKVCNFIENNFVTSFALGGTCAQGAAALASVGFPLIAHITDRCKEVCGLMDYSELYLITEKGIGGVMDSATNELPVRHMIFQFSKGDIVNIRGKEVTIPVSNRLIMDFDKIHKYLPIDEVFLRYCEENAENIFSYNISGFNAIIDMEIMKKKMQELGEHYQKVKDKNPDCIIYLEGAHYLNSQIKDCVFETASKYCDILGMNEEELVDFGEQFGKKIYKDNLESVLEGLSLAIKKYPVKGIVMHTKDYSMYYGQELKGIPIEKGLTMGNLMSGTRARTGKYGTYEDCKESLNLELSQTGLAFCEQLENIKISCYAKMVPSRYMEKPKYTIGLGDTFVAGMQIGFMK